MMSKKKIVLASILVVAALTATGCGGGSGDTSAVINDNYTNPDGSQVTRATELYDTTNLTIDGVSYKEAVVDATGSTPPSVPSISRN